MKPARPSTIAAKPVIRQRQRIPIPYGLFIALGIYALMVLGYIWLTYWRTPEYQAMEHYVRALQLIGRDEGISCTPEHLLEGYTELLEAARLVPTIRPLHERIEHLRWRFDERHIKLSKDMEMRAEAVSALYERARQEREPLLVSGVRDRGWAPDQLADGPGRAVLWSLPGAGVIIVLWLVWTFGPRRKRAEEHEQELVKHEQELEQLAGHRESARTGVQRPSGTKKKPGPR
jgi:hypothetical protein